MSGIYDRAFSFDEWKKLAEENPEAFEFTRQFMIDSLIKQAKEADRLKRLQWRIDMERRRSKNPMSACVRISSMMLDSFYADTGLAGVLQGRYSTKSAGDVVDMKQHQQKSRD
jgi:hypothetical protein